MRRAEHGVLIRFSVRYPRVGDDPERTLVKLRVWKSKKVEKPYVERRSRARIPSGRTTHYEFVVRGRAARALRRAGVGKRFTATRAKRRRPPEDYVTVLAQHARNIDSDSALDHTNTAAASGGALKDGTPVLGGPSGQVTFHNATGVPIVGTAGAGICMYASPYNSGHVSDLSSVNSAAMAPDYQTTMTLQTDKNLLDGVHNYTPIANAPDGQTPQAASLLFNAEARQFGFEMSTRYIAPGEDDPNDKRQARYPRWPDPIKFPGPNDSCHSATSNFVIGADTEAGLHTAALYSFDAKGAYPQATLNDFGLRQQFVQSGGHQFITVVQSSGPDPYKPAADCTGAGAVWMSCLYPPGTKRAQTQLTNVAIPGSHDSGTAQLGAANTDLFHPECDPSNEAETLAAPFIYNLAVAQRLNLRQQLDLGIRYFDIRAGYDTYYNVWRSYHSTFTQSTLDQDLATIAQWAGAHKKREPIIVDLTVCDAGKTPHVAQFQNVFSARPSIVKNVTNTKFDVFGIKDVTLDPPGSVAPNTFARMKLQDLYDFPAPSGNVLVLLHRYNAVGGPKADYDKSFLQKLPAFVEESGYGAYVPKDRVGINSQSPNAQPELKCNNPTGQNTYIQEYPYGTTNGPKLVGSPLNTYRKDQPVSQTVFMVTQVLYTSPTDAKTRYAWYKLAGAGKCPATLLDWESSLFTPISSTFPSTTDIITKWGDDANIVISDDVGTIRSRQGRTYVDHMVLMNQQRLANQGLAPPLEPINPPPPQPVDPPPPQVINPP